MGNKEIEEERRKKIEKNIKEREGTGIRKIKKIKKRRKSRK